MRDDLNLKFTGKVYVEEKPLVIQPWEVLPKSEGF